MAIRNYRNFVISAGAPASPGEAPQPDSFQVQVFRSPAGESGAIWRTIPGDLRRDLGRLGRRRLSTDEIISVGETLSEMLLPPELRGLLKSSLDRLSPGQGLRLRLRLAPNLVSFPWEYLYLQTGAGEKDSTGFLALDPRISIVRHEPLPLPGDLDATPRQRRLLVVLANPGGAEFAPLDLERERSNIENAVQGVPGIAPDFVVDATAQSLGDGLLAGADIFHFAGHGIFRQTGLGASLGSVVGEGAIVLVSEGGEPAPMPADQLAVNLRGRGVQLVVLGACETGQRDGENVWSGVVAALMEAGIPAAVAMQYKIWDDSAIAFSRSLYRALAAGLPLDQAVSAGRLAVFNLVHPLRGEPERGPFWRDWGVPVLYLRAEDDFVLPAIADSQEQQALEASLEAPLVDRVPGRPAPPPPLMQTGDVGTYVSEVQELQRRMARGQLVVFLGADLPQELTGLPGRSELADRLAQQSGLAPGERLATVAQQVMDHGNRWEFTELIRRELEAAALGASPFYDAFAALILQAELELVITTAYHRLLEAALRAAGTPFNLVIREQDLRFSQPDRTTLIKLYGDIEQVDTLVVTEQDHNALLRGRDRPELVDEVRRAFRRNAVLFVGYDLADPDVSAWFDEVAGDRFQAGAYAVWSGMSIRQAESLRSNRGLTVIDAPPLGILRALSAGEAPA
jgi:hypothetical protein